MLTARSLNPALEDPLLDTMNFLNEVTARYPDAISFAPGRPHDAFFDVRASLAALDVYTEHASQSDPLRRSPDQVLGAIAQYGRTKGIITGLVRTMLRHDEGIDVDEESIVVTVGAQEAMMLVLATVLRPGEDVLLVADPTYIGISGIARVLGLGLVPVSTGPSGLDLADLERRIAAVRAEGKQPKMLYVIPDFSNPHGTSLARAARSRLLELSRTHDFLILEDNAYGLFAYDLERLPTLKALDRDRRVVYVGTFSKILYPGLRVGFLIADQAVALPGGHTGLLADEIAKVKSMTSVNTSSINQAIVGGLLLEHSGTFLPYIREKCAFYGRNRDALVASLSRHFPDAARSGISWNVPSGGFFLTLTLPFEVTGALLLESARDFGVLWVPMRYFYLGPGGGDQIRLAFSYLTPAEIEEGVARLARLLAPKLHERRET
jgi:(S)-3,5-dihydroxyphenylglycine transaminase